MNLPVSKPIVENVFLEVLEPNKLLSDFVNKKFTGFLYLVISSKNNFEENILFFEKGDVVGSIYLNNTCNLNINGLDAFKLSMNSLSFKDGILNIYELSGEQLKLILIFNEKIKYFHKLDSKIISKMEFNYDESLFENMFKDKIDFDIKPRYNLFGEFNINDLLRS